MLKYAIATAVCAGLILGCAHADDAKISEAMTVVPKVKVDAPYKVLLYHKASGFRHASIPTINRCFQIMGEKTGAFTVDLSEDPAELTPEKLKMYKLLIFNNTTKVQNAFTTPEQRAALLDYVRGGGGFVAIHGATDAGSPEWAAYTEMVGGVFDGHPWNANGTWGISIDDPNHCCMDHFGNEPFLLTDELYKYKEYDRKNQRVLATIDTRVSPKGNAQRPDNDHALAWVRNYGEGRVFVSAFGHNDFLCWNPKILQLWLNGVQFAAGDLSCDTAALPQPEWQKPDAQKPADQ